MQSSTGGSLQNNSLADISVNDQVEHQFTQQASSSMKYIYAQKCETNGPFNICITTQSIAESSSKWAKNIHIWKPRNYIVTASTKLVKLEYNICSAIINYKRHPTTLGWGKHHQRRWDPSSVCRPALLHDLAYSPIVFALVFTEHACSFRIRRRIGVRITEQWLQHKSGSNVNRWYFLL